MSESENIPKDIWEAAEARFEEYLSIPSGQGRPNRPAVLVMARAIMSERTRCNDIVEAHRKATAPSQSDLIGSIVHMINSGEEP